MELNLPVREQIALPPAWLLNIMKVPSPMSLENTSVTPVSSLNRDLGGCFSMPPDGSVGEGTRNNFLTKAAGWMQTQGVKGSAMVDMLKIVNVAKCVPPLDYDEVEKVASSVKRYDNEKHTVPDSEGEWPVPEKLDESMPPVAQFNPRLLPKGIHEYVADVAERMSCPIDFPGIACMVAIGAALGSRIFCKPYDKGTWLVPGGFWGMLVSPPSAIKSPPVSEMFRPLNALDKAAGTQFANDVQSYEIQKAIYDNAVKAAVKSGNTSSIPTMPVEPCMRRYIVNDSTYEMLVNIAAANPDGFLVWRDELVGWFHSLSKENQKEARGLYLSGFNGTDGYATDRIGRGHVRADRVNLSVFGTIQPNVLRTLVHDAVSGGIGDDGLVARFQLAVYPDSVREYVKVDRYPDLPNMQLYEETIKKLAQIAPLTVGASFTSDGLPYLPFSEEGQVVFDEWRAKLEKRIRADPSDEHPAMLAHLGKYRSLVPKIALVLHLSNNGYGPITKNAVIKAVAWAIYLESHARRIYHTATNRALQSAVALANKIKANKLGDVFTRSDVLIKEWSGLRTAEEVGTALTVLRDMKWLFVVEDRSTGGRPAERWHINPRVNRAN